MSPATRPETSIALLEVHAPSADAIATRLHVERLLGMMELRPRSLAPRAILCVRELRDPLPGGLSPDRRRAAAPAAWERAAQRELDRLAREAAWPGRTAVPPSADAVAFVDEAELLACLGSDLATGRVAARWWWPLLVGGAAERPRAVSAAWARAAEHAPAALQILAERRQAETFVRALPPDDLTPLLVEIGARFALPAGVAAPARASGGLAAGADCHTPAPSGPWRPWVEEAESADLTTEGRALLGVGLALVRAPTVARSAWFAEAVVAWRAAAAATPAFAAPARQAPAPVGAEAARGPGRSPPDPAAGDGASQVGPPPAGHRGQAGSTSAVRHTDRHDELDPGGAQGHSSASAADSARADDTAIGAQTSREPGAWSDAQVPGGAAPMTAAADRTAGEAAPAEAPAIPTHWSAPSTLERRPLSWRPRTRAFGAPTDTALGGLFYLVNVALYLGLYGDQGNLELPLWDFVALIGRRLLGARAVDDPIWTLLAELAGRAPDDAPGAGFEPPLDWRLPPAWLAPFPDVTDVAVDADLDVAKELGALEVWVERISRYLVARLGRALDVGASELPDRLLAHAARIHVTDTHVDVVFLLDALPVAIRFAGLDRDPGWVAAAGRFIAFHFE
jgi:hypothetical protein